MLTRINVDQQILQSASEEEVRQALTRVLNSKYFANAPKKQEFLRLTCDFHLNGRGAELNEYLIGREVFGRDDSYNPATDPIVRVGAHGVRKKLALYYEGEGANDEIRIEIPVGNYAPAFVRTGQAQSFEAAAMLDGDTEFGKHSLEGIDAELATDESQFRVARKWLLAMGIAIGALSVIVIALLVMNRNLRQKAEGEALTRMRVRNSQGAVWEPFLKSGEPTLLILSNPTVLRTMHGADPDVLTRRAISLTEEQAMMLISASGGRLPIKQDRPLQLVPAFNMYTGIGEAVGVYRLSSLLQADGEQTILKQSRSIGPEDLRDHDMILLGSVYSNQWSQPLITVAPGVTGERTIMVLAGIYSEGTEAAAEFVTSANYLSELNHRLCQLGGQTGPPRYYQALLKVRVENSFPTKVSLLTVRELQAAAQ